jgi:hypothetical protein
MKKKVLLIFILFLLAMPLVSSFSIIDLLNKVHLFFNNNLISGKAVYNVLQVTCNIGQQVGDVNGNSLINDLDASIALNISFGLDPIPNDICCVDVDGNGIIESTDSSLILQIAAGSMQSPGTCGACTSNSCNPNNNQQICNTQGTAYNNCNSGQICDNSQCIGSFCSNECSQNNLQECSYTSNGYRICGDYDNDLCLEWSSITPCNQGETCSNGQCSPSCTNGCSQADLRECSSNGYRICGNYNNDLCLEWSNIYPCEQGQICLNGACTSSTTNSAINKCSDGTSYEECSASKPLFCSSGTLINRCNICTCPNDGKCQLDGSCISTIQTVESSNLNLLINPPIFSFLPELLIDKDQPDLTNLINLDTYAKDPANKKLDFTFQNKQKTFNSDIIDCFINNNIFGCGNPKREGILSIDIFADNGIKSSSSKLSLKVLSKNLQFAQGGENQNIIPDLRKPIGKDGFENKAPIANAGEDKTIPSSTIIILDASKSYDEEGNLPNSPSNYIWYENGQEIGKGLNLKKVFPPGTHKITLQVIDADGLSSTDTIFVSVKSKTTCKDTNAIYVPEDTICNKKWPSQEGSLLTLNSRGYSCNLVEVCDENLDPLIEDSIDCCDGTPLIDDRSKANACSFANKYSVQDTKKCQALYLIESLGGDSVYMKDYLEAEMCCKGVKELCGNPINFYTAKPLPRTGKDLSKLKCYNTQDNSPPGEWVSDTKLELNNIALQDPPTHVSLNILATGTCADYSFALTTLLRKVGYNENEVYTVEAPDHAYNIVRLPLDRKYTIIDTTGNYNLAIVFGNTPPGYEYCENMKNCYNDNGESLCPPLQEIYGCENVKQNLVQKTKVVGFKTNKILNIIIKLVKTELER